MAGAFQARSLEQRYAFLDACPPGLLPSVVTLPVGRLEERVVGARSWHSALLAGRVPPPNTWPCAPVDQPVRRALKEMGLVRFCADQPDLVNALMKDILAAFAREALDFGSEVVGRLRELEALERVRLAKEEAGRARREKRRARSVRLDDDTLQRLREAAERDVAGRNLDADGEIVAAWGKRARAWAEIADVFGDLGQMLGRGWDLARGVLKHTG